MYLREDDEKWMANARLVAAAPELLEALEGAERLLKDLHADGIEYDFGYITAAIAKATGAPHDIRNQETQDAPF